MTIICPCHHFDCPLLLCTFASQMLLLQIWDTPVTIGDRFITHYQAQRWFWVPWCVFPSLKFAIPRSHNFRWLGDLKIAHKLLRGQPKIWGLTLRKMDLLERCVLRNGNCLFFKATLVCPTIYILRFGLKYIPKNNASLKSFDSLNIHWGKIIFFVRVCATILRAKDKLGKRISYPRPMGPPFLPEESGSSFPPIKEGFERTQTSKKQGCSLGPQIAATGLRGTQDSQGMLKKHESFFKLENPQIVSIGQLRLSKILGFIVLVSH